MPSSEPTTIAVGNASVAPPPPSPAALRSGALLVLALGSLGVFVVFLDTTIVNIAFPTISRAFNTTTSGLAWVLNAYSLVFAAMLIPAGRLADRYGRKRMFLIGLAGFAVMSALCGIAPSTGVLVAGRALQALFSALVVPTSLALILPEFPPARRHIAVGTWGTMGAAAAALGPTLGALLTEYASWRWVFLVNVPICALLIVLGLRALSESRDTNAAGLPDPLGTLLIAGIPALLSFAIIEGPGWGWGDARVVTAFVLAGLLLPAFVVRSLRATRPVMNLKLFSDRQFSLVSIANLLFSTAFYGMLLGNVIFLQTVWHYPVLRAALAAVPTPLVVTAVSRAAATLASRIGYRAVMLAGGICWAVGSAALALVIGSTPHWLGTWLPWAILLGLGIGLTLPVQAGAAVQNLPPGEYGVGSAINSSFRQLGAVLGISVFVAVLGHGGVDGFRDTWWVFAALGLASGLVVQLAGIGARKAEIPVTTT
jgi:EmrB/QacA subfamily drug resistance transporter